MAGCVVETLLYVTLCLRRRRIPAVAALVDAGVTIAALWPGTLLLDGPATAYNYLIVAIPAAGLAGWRFATALGVALLAAGATPAAMPPASWTAVPDIGNPVMVVLIAWLVGTATRAAARHVDVQRERAVAAASKLAQERERVRHAETLRDELLAVLVNLATTDAVADEYVRQQLRAEVRWLKRFVAAGSPGPSGEVLADLRALLVEKERATGLRIRARWPDVQPVMADDRAEALLGATREALTNAAKHAGVTDVSVVVEVTADAVSVEVSDDGRGFDTSAPVAGVGIRESIQRRLAEAGGRSSVESAPHRGTRVYVRVPVGR
ncbi:hypothetical protein GCM10029964_104720 [Kibdelosporangium lantanae]